MGVQRVMEVEAQLETHNFGLETARAVCGVECINEESAKWPDSDAAFMYGNPRCTGFSTITSGYDENAHGAWSKPTIDIHQLCEYAAGRADIVVWESVQQAMKTGKPLLDYLRDEIFAPKGYRVAHVLLNAASFGNAQQRKRYFFVAYRDDRNFNITPPTISPYYPVLYDAIYDDRDRETREIEHPGSADYDRNTYNYLTPDEKHCVPNLPNGWNLNTLARYGYDGLSEHLKEKWDLRASEMPFSLHCILRLNWLRPSPTLHSSCCRFIHPDHNRPLTVGELSTIMGWDDIPLGPHPWAQIAKGIAPSAGEWLANQAVAYLDNEWGSDDFESSYDPALSEWVGRDTTGEREKTFDLTKYCGYQFDMERYACAPQSHRFNICPRTGRPIRPWKEIEYGYLNRLRRE